MSRHFDYLDAVLEFDATVSTVAARYFVSPSFALYLSNRF